MRPVNLIPPDDRAGDTVALRTGSFIYVLMGGLALLLLGIVALALTSKQVSDRQAEKAGLEQQLAKETARAQSVVAFSNFRAVQETRASTVSSLAQSRFDWSRVLHELSLVVPTDISLQSLIGSAAPDVKVEGGTAVELRSSITGPALEITGCAPDQDAVAGFVSAVEDVDGVTRVGLDSSTVAEDGSGSSSSSSGESGGAQCPPHVLTFQLVAAFDAVPTPPTATSAPSVPAAAAPTTSGSTQVASTQVPGS